MQTDKFAIVLGIDHESAFNWQVEHELKKRERIIASVRKQQTRYLKKSHIFGIDFLKTAEQDFTLYAKNGNALLAGAFKILSDGKKSPIGHQFVSCHMVHDIKMEDF